MAMKELVNSVNGKLKAVEADMISHKENPRMLSLVHELVRLTNSEEDNAKLDEKAEAEAPQCPHEVISRKTGKCVACGEIPDEE
jgi:hypothetical protein